MTRLNMNQHWTGIAGVSLLGALSAFAVHAQDPCAPTARPSLACLQQQVNALKALTNCMRQVGNTLVFEGCNVQIVSGSGRTDDGGALRGLGNLIIGYNEHDQTNPAPRNGSHNLILGQENGYASYAGIAAGLQNDSLAPYASVLGGTRNAATAERAVVVAGSDNEASGRDSTVGGGQFNEASGVNASVTGGLQNEALGFLSSVTGGAFNQALASRSTVAGGNHLTNTVADTVLGATGPKGDKGDKGDTGATGAPGPAGLAELQVLTNSVQSATGSVQMDCPTGKQAVGGGAGETTSTQGYFLVESRPVGNPPTGWFARNEGGVVGGHLFVYVICAKVGS